MTDSIAFKGRKHKVTPANRREFIPATINGPRITSITPNVDTVFGGTTATVVGQNFVPNMIATFGGANSPQVTYVNSTTVTVVVPFSDRMEQVNFTLQRPDFGASDSIAFYYEAPEMLNGLRLSLTSATPVPTVDVAAGSTLYFTAYKSNYISLWNGTFWQTVKDVDVALNFGFGGLTSGKNYDVFAYLSFPNASIELSSAWASDTVRTDALSRQNGILVKASDPTRRYVGTVRATGTTTFADTVTKRFVWNYDNRVLRAVSVADTTASWGQTNSTWRQANSNTANKVELVCGDAVEANAYVSVMAGQATNVSHVRVGVGVDSIAADSAFAGGHAMAIGAFAERNAYWEGVLTQGYHYLAWLEQGENATTTWFGDGSIAGRNARLRGVVSC